MKKQIYKLPADYIAAVETYYPKHARTILRAAAYLPRTTFRINRLRASLSRFRAYCREQHIHYEKVSWYEDAFILRHPSQRQLQETRCYTDGWIYLQNLSSMVPPLLLDPQPGEKILDLCAAPGSKTTQIASMTGNNAEIVAVEKIKPRFYRLRANCERMGVRASLICRDGSKAVYDCHDYFDKVLVDAPCSAEGLFNVHKPKSFAYWSKRKVREMKHKQKRLIAAGWRALRSGGKMVYSTCTFSPQENEDIVQYLIRKFGDEVIFEKVRLPFSNAVQGLTRIDGRQLDDRLTACRHIIPTETMEGFFVALFKKA